MGITSASKLNFRNSTDQKIIEAFCMSTIVSTIAEMQRTYFQLQHGKYIGPTSDQHTQVFTPLTLEEKTEFTQDLERSRKKVDHILKDVKGNSEEFETPLQTYLNNYKAPADKEKQKIFKSLKDIPKRAQKAIHRFATATQQERNAMNLSKENLAYARKFSTLPLASRETLLDFYRLSQESQKALNSMEKMSRVKVLKLTQQNLNLAKKEKGKFSLSDSDIKHIENIARDQQIDIKGVRKETNSRYSSEKNVVSKVLLGRAMTLLTLVMLGTSVIHLGSNLTQDIQTIFKSNNQTAQTLIANGYTHDNFSIPFETYNKLLEIKNQLNDFSTKEPSHEQQLELVENMSNSYKSVIEEKSSAAFLEEHPEADITDFSIGSDAVTFTYSENGTVKTETIKVTDLPMQKSNMADLLFSFTTLGQIKAEIEKDVVAQQEIDSALQNGTTPSASEYTLAYHTQDRIRRLTELHSTALDATALNLEFRDNWIFKDEFVTREQTGDPVFETPGTVKHSPDEQASPSSNVSREETVGQKFFETNDFKSVDVLTHLKQFYAREHNVANPGESVSSSEIKITKPEQNYTFLVTVGEKSFIMTHGSYPAGVREFLDNETAKGTLSYEVTDAIPITQVVKDANIYDDNGNHQKSVMVDGAAYYNGTVYPVISGNFHKTCLDPNYKSVLADKNMYGAAEAMFAVKTPYATTDYHINRAKGDYADQLNAYCESHGYTIDNLSDILPDRDDDLEH